MSRIFEAFEKVWDQRHGRRIPQASKAAPELPPLSGLAPPKNGYKNGSAPRPAAEPVSTALTPLLGSVRIRLTNGAPILPFDGTDHRAAEQYKIARTKILRHPLRPCSLVVTSAQIDDGKSVSAVNLAGCLALKDQTSVLLVDADMRRSNLADTLGVPASPGLADVLAGRCGLDKAIVRLEPLPNFYFLPKGERPENPTELLDSARWRTVSALIKKEFGFVVIDAPPLGLVADYDLVEVVADGVILVVRPDHTNRALCLKAIDSIPPEKMIGVLINCVKDWFLTKPFGHRYDYYYDEKS
jgi:capsular exopolysaccharide synthesis family protein